MDKLVPGLFVAAISGITFIAYKHPTGYQRLFWLLGIIFGIASVAGIIWDTSSAATAFALRPFIPPANRAAALAALDNPIERTWAIWSGLTFLYLLFLLGLPRLLREQQPPNK